MDNEGQAPEVGELEQTGTGEESRQFSPVEELAMEIGWNPDFDGNGAVDAATYIRRSRQIQDEMSETVKSLKRDNHETKQSLQAVRAHFEKVNQAERARLEREIQALRAERDTAIEDADKAKVHEIDQKIRETEVLQAQPVQPPQTATNPDFDDWHKGNDWYGKDAEMTAYADSLAEDPRYSRLPAKRLYKAVEKTVKEMFADKFEAENGNGANGSTDSSKQSVKTRVAPGPEGVRQRSVKGFGEGDLTQVERESMLYFERRGIMTRKDYLADIARARSEGA